MTHSSTALPRNEPAWPIPESLYGAAHRELEAVRPAGVGENDGAQQVYVDNGIIVIVRNRNCAGLPEPAGRGAQVTGIGAGGSTRITPLDILARLASRLPKGGFIW